ncbi:choice-of-anchor D domain-containing protein, partial [bacterium]|nr:choice-of-anchor D domain-containing protein [bacterium]
MFTPVLYKNFDPMCGSFKKFSYIAFVLVIAQSGNTRQLDDCKKIDPNKDCPDINGLLQNGCWQQIDSLLQTLPDSVQHTPARRIVLTDTLVSFGKVKVCRTASRLIGVGNAGEIQTIVLNGISLTDSVISPFRLDLPPRKQRFFKLCLTPKDTGFVCERLTFRNTATEGDSSVKVTAIGIAPIIEPSSKQIDFGKVAVGKSKTITLTIHNRGLDTLAISRMWLKSDPIYTVNPIAISVLPNSSYHVEITFQPQNASPYLDTLRIESNKLYGCDRIPVNGTGFNGPAIQLSQSCLDFATVTIGDTVCQELIVSNAGNQDLRFSVNPCVIDSFFIVKPCSGTIAPDRSLPLRVCFAPLNNKLQQPTLTISSNAVDGDSTTCLKGKGVKPPGLCLSMKALDFGAVCVEQKDTLSFFVTNCGDVTLRVENIIWRDLDAFHAGPVHFQLDSGKSQQIFVIFRPDETLIYYNDTLRFESNAKGPDSLIVLSGQGEKALLVVYPDTLEFGKVRVGFCQTRNDTLKNQSTKPIIIYGQENSLPNFQYELLQGTIKGSG